MPVLWVENEEIDFHILTSDGRPSIIRHSLDGYYMESPIGTYVRVEKTPTGLIARTPTGSIATDVPPLTMQRAFNSGSVLEKLERQWRQRDPSVFPDVHQSPMPAVIQSVAHELNTNQVNIAATNFDFPKEHAEIVKFLATCEVLKPKMLKLDPLKWRFAMRAVLRGENLMIRGEAGCGKTLLAQVLQQVTGRPFYYFNLGSTQDPRSTLIGNTHFKKDEGTYVAEALFVKAIQTENAIILLDEVSRALHDAHNILMSVLDQKQRYLRIDERPDTPTIKVAKGVTFLGTANVGAEYTATRTMDRAFLDRWTMILMEPLTKEQEIELLTEMFPTLDKFDITAIAEIASDTRAQVKSANPKVETIISTRVTTEMAALLFDGFSLEEAATVKIYPFYSDAGGAESQRTYMMQLVQKYVKEKSYNNTIPKTVVPPKNTLTKPY
jgi:MoxR-like ATPase